MNAPDGMLGVLYFREMRQGNDMPDEPNNTVNNGNSNTPAGETPATPDTWDAWVAARPEAERAQIAALYDKQTAGLRTALDSERTQRKEFEKQLRDAAKDAEKGSKAQQDLTAMADTLAAAERRADFYEASAKPEIGLVGVKAAWTLMNAEPDRYFDRKGNPNFELLKQEHPYLFGQKTPAPKGNQGNGTQGQPPAGQTFNDVIRQAAGKAPR